MKVGAHSWLLETRYPLLEAMAEARRIGYDGYEVDIGNFGGTGLGLQILPDRMRDEHRDDIRRAAAEADIEISSLCLGALWNYPLTSSDEAYRKRGVEIVQAAIPLARSLDARCILLPIPQPPGLSDKEAWEMTVRALDECLPTAEEGDVILAVENVCSPFLKGAPELGRLVDELASPACRVYYDVGNGAWIGLDPVAEILELGDRIARFHFKNRNSLRGTPGTDTVSVSDPGIVPCKRAFDAIRSIGYDGYLTVEVPTLHKDADKIARENLATVRAWIDTGRSSDLAF
jgi:L-ribulose-5-phosphate 3-epimerase